LNRLTQHFNHIITIASGLEFDLRQLPPLEEDISEARLLWVTPQEWEVDVVNSG
jgi:hypothetical protein